MLRDFLCSNSAGEAVGDMDMLEGLLSVFHQHDPLRYLSRKELKRLSGTFREKEFKAGQDILVQGKVIKMAGFLIEGSAHFLISDRHGNSVNFGQLENGDFFGEMVLFSDKTSIITIRCNTECRCYVQNIPDFCKMLNLASCVRDYFLSLALERARAAYKALLEHIGNKGLINTTTGQKTISTPLERTILFIKNNYTRPITLGEVSRFCGISRYHFSRIFKVYTGYSFKEFLIRERLNAAKKLFREGEMNVSEVCYAVGFNDLSYFSRTFKRLEGMPPSEYMKMAKNMPPLKKHIRSSHF